MLIEQAPRSSWAWVLAAVPCVWASWAQAGNAMAMAISMASNGLIRFNSGKCFIGVVIGELILDYSALEGANI